MNRDSDEIQRHILSLLKDLLPTASLEDVEAASRALGNELTNSPNSVPSNLPISPSANSSISDNFSESDRSFRKEPAIDLGDVPAVQDRFHALLKNRLQSEIQQNPPLFPWETSIQDYEAEAVYQINEDVVKTEPVPVSGAPTPVWLRHLRQLDLPVKVPEGVLSHILNNCQTAVQSTLREGARLVRAVEDLFPEQPEALNYLAGLVMTSPARSGKTMAATASNANFPTNYELAAPAQQMVLSLLAAREILKSLNISVSSEQPTVERHWETDAGMVTVRVMYEPAVSLRVQVAVPSGAEVNLQGRNAQSVAQRPGAGILGVEVFDLEGKQPYSLEVRLDGQSSLTFAISVVD